MNTFYSVHPYAGIVIRKHVIWLSGNTEENVIQPSPAVVFKGSQCLCLSLPKISA